MFAANGSGMWRYRRRQARWALPAASIWICPSLPCAAWEWPPWASMRRWDRSWAMPSMFLRGTAAAGGIALINSVGNLGGFAGPYLVGWIKDRTGSYSAGMALLACGLASATVLVLMLGRLETAALRAEAARINGTGAARATPAYRRG